MSPIDPQLPLFSTDDWDMGREIPRRIGDWTALKLEYLDHYLQAYRIATKRADPAYYMDLFAGCGDCVLKRDGSKVEGSAWRALHARPQFELYLFIEEKPELAAHLLRRVTESGISKAEVLVGDCNGPRLEEALLKIPRQAPSFAFIDPTGLQVRWDTVRRLASHRLGRRKMELLILYPYDMVIKRWLTWPNMANALTTMYGDNSWEGQWLESVERCEDESAKRQRFVELYKRNLRNLGYRIVDDYGPLGYGERYYYNIIFASDEPVGQKIMRDVWAKPRLIPGQMNYKPLRRPGTA